MADYQETTAEGKLWKRCRQVIIDNPFEGAKLVRFFEENIVMLGGQTVRADAGFCQTEFSPSDLVPVLDLETLEPTGEMVPHLRIYQLLLSAYLKTAIWRDNGTTATTLVPEPPTEGE